MSNQLEFHLEGLENRELMAVDVSLSGDQLTIKGDNDGDTVDVQGTGSDGHVEVFVNTVLAGTYTGVIRIRANMRGGNDVLFMSAVFITGDVTIKMGSGEDKFDPSSRHAKAVGTRTHKGGTSDRRVRGFRQACPGRNHQTVAGGSTPRPSKL